MLLRRYRVNKESATVILEDEKLVEKYKQKGFKVVSTEEVDENKDVEKFVCKVCGVKCKSEKSLDKHINTKHADVKITETKDGEE